MKNVLFTLVILVFVLQGCKKDDEIDPRDQFVGTWNVTQTISITELGLLDNYEIVYTIKKDNLDKRKIIIFDGARDIMAIVDGNTYNCKYTVSLWDGSNTGTEEITSRGVIQDNKINETGTAQINMWGKSSNGIWSAVCTRK